MEYGWTHSVYKSKKNAVLEFLDIGGLCVVFMSISYKNSIC